MHCSHLLCSIGGGLEDERALSSYKIGVSAIGCFLIDRSQGDFGNSIGNSGFESGSGLTGWDGWQVRKQPEQFYRRS